MSGETNEKIIEQLYADDSVDLSAEILIHAGVNPFFAWMYVKNISENDLIKKLGLDQVEPAERKSVVLQFLGYSNKAPVGTLASYLRSDAMEIPPVAFIHGFCRLLNISPADLIVFEYPFTEKTDMTPVNATLLEAAMLHAEDLFSTRQVDPRLDVFLESEKHKAKILSERVLVDGQLSNAQWLQRIRNEFVDDVDMQFDEDGMRGTDAGIVEQFLYKQEVFLGRYDAKLRQDINDIEAEIARHDKMCKAQSEIINRCAAALAPMGEEKAWTEAFYNKGVMGKVDGDNIRGVAKANEMLLKNPSVFYPVRSNWKTSAGMAMPEPDGRYFVGDNVVRAFCDAYTNLQEPALAKKREEKALVQAQKEYDDFKRWFRTLETKIFLVAVANRDSIEACQDCVIQGMPFLMQPASVPSAGKATGFRL